MPAPYSFDLRERVVEAYEAGGHTYESIAETFQVGVATVNRWLRRRRVSGDVAPSPHGGGQKPLIRADAERLLRELVEAQPDATLAELVERLGKSMERPPRKSTVARALARMGITRKKRLSSLPNERAMPRSSSAGSSRSSGSAGSPTGSSSSTRAG